MPGISFDKRPGLVSWLKGKLPLYFSFQSSVAGMSRKETVEDQAALLANGIKNPIITPTIVQRLDFRPEVTLPLNLGGWNFTATAAARGTFYSNSIDPLTRLVLPANVTRVYGEFTFDVRPPALARNFHHADGSFWFRHVVEPYLTYKKISGVSDFDRVIRFDEVDAAADTNEVEYGVTNRFFLRRSTETVKGRPATREEARRNERGGASGGAPRSRPAKRRVGRRKATRRRPASRSAHSFRRTRA